MLTRTPDPSHLVAPDAIARIVITMTRIDERDQDRLELLDRIAERVPELDLEKQSVEWTTLDDGHEALLVNGGGIDGGDGAFFANYGDDVHAYGSRAPVAEGWDRVHRDPAGRHLPADRRSPLRAQRECGRTPCQIISAFA